MACRISIVIYSVSIVPLTKYYIICNCKLPILFQKYTMYRRQATNSNSLIPILSLKANLANFFSTLSTLKVKLAIII